MAHRWTLSLPMRARFQVVKQPRLLKRLEVQAVRRHQRAAAGREGRAARRRGVLLAVVSFTLEILMQLPQSSTGARVLLNERSMNRLVRAVGSCDTVRSRVRPMGSRGILLILSTASRICAGASMIRDSHGS